MSAAGSFRHALYSIGASYFVVSLVANAIYRWPSHDPRWKEARGVVWPLGEIFRRHELHHQAFPRFDRPAHDNRTLYALDIDARVTAAMVVLLAGPLLWADWMLGLAMAAAVVLHNHIYNAIHFEMHAPRERWFSRTALFRYYAWYHFLHHRHPAARFDFGLPASRLAARHAGLGHRGGPEDVRGDGDRSLRA